jgi:hypothetical protein
MLDVAVHPWAPTLREILARDFSKTEAEEFERIFRPIVEKSEAEQKELVVYLTAEKHQPPPVIFQGDLSGKLAPAGEH